MYCEQEVSDLINRPVVSLLGTRVGSTSAEVVTKSVYLKLLAPTSRERHFRKERDLGSNRRSKKGLPETSRPGLISTMRPDLPQPTHRLEPKDTLGGIHFLRLKAISVRRTESSVVATMRCWQRRRSCSARRETANISWRSRKGCQWLSICMVTRC